VSGYNSLQSGDIAALSGIPTILLLATFPILVRAIDIRLAIAFGLFLYGVSCFMNAYLSPDVGGPQLVLAQFVRGVAQFFSIIFLNQAATNAVAKDLADDASGLFNAARNLGGSFGLAMVATLQDQRQTFHEHALAESISANSLVGQAALHDQGLSAIQKAITDQATVMTYSDLYWVFGVALFVMIPLVLLLKPLPKNAEISVGG
jgi:DHA2 family multidrug resistance protein